jgi:pyrroline-5-carboxylate reductase
MSASSSVTGFLGYGNMARALIEGLCARGLARADAICIHDTDPARADAARAAGLRVAGDAAGLARDADVLVLAVKPQQMDAALAPLLPGFDPRTLVVSIAAGVTLGRLAGHFGTGARLVRVMPNTPALVGAGAAGIALGDQCTADDRARVVAMFEAVGVAEVVPESALDAVTALSGSGPAYFFRMVECLTEAAVGEGLEPQAAARLAAQTLLGAGRLLAESGEAPGALRERVTSKGGTTAAALDSLGRDGFQAVVGRAVAAAAARSRELGQ